MVILPATEADLQAVIELVAQGRAALARQGVDQWQDGYPSPETIRRDLLRGDGRIVRIDGAAAAYAAFVFDGEPAYDRIEEGGWAAEGPYVAVHRLVVGERFVRRGVAAALLREAAREALVRGMEDGSVRRDLDLEMVYLNLVNLLTGGVNFRILIDEATQMKIIRSSAEILLYYVKNSGR